MRYSCGANDIFYLRREIRHLIYEQYKQAVTDRFLDELFFELGFAHVDLKQDKVFIEGKKEFDKED